MEILQPYNTGILIIGLSGFILCIQLIVVDVAGVKSRHRPGFPITPDKNSFLFRSARAFANTNESVTIFIVFMAFAILTLADPVWVNRWATLYFVGRLAHMACYYAGIGLARSASFVVSLVGLIGLFVIALQAWMA